MQNIHLEVTCNTQKKRSMSSQNTVKTPKESFASKSEILFPNHTNQLNKLMGGNLLHWMDSVGAICAQRHSNKSVVTASVDNVSFKHPIPLGAIITLEAKVTRAFNSSMEINIQVFSENIIEGTTTKTNEAFYTFVALDKSGKPTKIPNLKPETEKEKELFESALRRRQVRLILGGRISIDQATELKDFLLFNEKKND